MVRVVSSFSRSARRRYAAGVAERNFSSSLFFVGGLLRGSGFGSSLGDANHGRPQHPFPDHVAGLNHLGHRASGDMLRLGGGSLVTHELQAEAKEVFTDAPMKLVQWVRFGSGSFIRMVGMARADQWSTLFPRFRAVRDGVMPRE